MKRTLIFVGILATIACAFGLLFLFWRGHSPDVPASPGIADAGVAPVVCARSLPPLPKREEPQEVDPEAFYQTIIDNNIFRPLNWEPPQRESAYTLLGTAVATDGSRATAYIQERKSGQFYAVSVGEKIGDVTVQEINGRQVILTARNGKTLQLHLGGFQFLNSRRESPLSERSYEQPPQVARIKENETAQKKRANDITANKTGHQRMYEEGIEHLKKRADAIRAERKRMMERLQHLQQR